MISENSIEQLEKGITVFHPIFREVSAEILRFIQYGRHDECLALIGPSGVGKSTMIRYLMCYLADQQAKGWRKNFGPPIVIEAPAPEKGHFSWRTILELLLTALGEIDLTHKVDLDKSEEIRRTQGKRSSYRLSIGQLEALLRTRIHVLKPIAIFIDESQNLVASMSPDRAWSNVVRLKGWANTMETKFFLTGTHEARGLLDINEQLARRMVPIYFPRYPKTKEGLRNFAVFYKGIITASDLPVDRLLHANFEEVYNCTLGCPGLLTSMLQRSAAYCIDKKLPAISKEVFYKNRLTYTHLEEAERTIKEFEAFYELTKKPFNPDLVVLDLNFDTAADTYIRRPRSSKSKNSKPGQRKPIRDAVK